MTHQAPWGVLIGSCVATGGVVFGVVTYFHRQAIREKEFLLEHCKAQISQNERRYSKALVSTRQELQTLQQQLGRPTPSFGISDAWVILYEHRGCRGREVRIRDRKEKKHIVANGILRKNKRFALSNGLPYLFTIP